MDAESVAVEHIAGPFTPSHWQRCVRCNVCLRASDYLLPIYPDYVGKIGKFPPYEPVWIFDGAIWPASPDPEKIKIVFCGASH